MKKVYHWKALSINATYQSGLSAFGLVFSIPLVGTFGFSVAASMVQTPDELITMSCFSVLVCGHPVMLAKVGRTDSPTANLLMAVLARMLRVTL